MNTSTPNSVEMIVKVTGPHPALLRWRGKPAKIWRVAIVSLVDRKPKGMVYRCMSYTRAVSLSCNMARDRKLFLHLEALPK
jgi:hypothetical protein